MIANRANIGKAVLWTLGTLLSFSVMAVSIRELSRGGLSIFQILAVRTGCALLILTALVVTLPRLREMARPQNMKLNIARNLVQYAGQYAWALSLTLIPLATVFALEFTTPIWTALFASFFLGERMTPSRIGVVILGLIGVLVILRPGLASFHPASALVLVAAVGYASMYVMTKKLTATQSTFGILFWMSVIQFPLALAGSNPAFFFDSSLYDLGHILPAIGLGIAGLTSHLCLSNAFRAGDAMLVVPLDFMRIPLIALVGWALYGEVIDIWVLVGALIIIAGVIWNLRAERARARLS